MIKVVYYRTEADVEDYREFRNEKEFAEWFASASKWERIIIRDRKIEK